MLANLSRKFARLGLTVALACGLTLLAANAGLAATKVLSGTHSFGQVAAACGAAGSTFVVHQSGGYDCAANGNLVSCNGKGKCTGTCDKACASIAKGLNGVLRPPASAGTASAARTTGSNAKAPLRNVNQPVVVQHFGGAHSGGSKR